LFDNFATAVSLCLQYGVPMKDLTKKFRHQKFDPQGFTSIPKDRGEIEKGKEAIRGASSITDYIFHWLDDQFVQSGNGNEKEETKTESNNPKIANNQDEKVDGAMGICEICGGILVKSGKCDKRCIGTCGEVFKGECSG